MKHSLFVFTLFLTVFCTNAFLPAQIVHAQNTPTTPGLPASPTVAENTLTPANGWTPASASTMQGIGNALAGQQADYYTNKNGQTAECISTGSVGGLSGCTITNKDGSIVQTVNNTVSGGATNVSATASGVVTASSETPPPTSGTCDITKMGSWGDCLSFAGAYLALALLSFAGVILGLAGTLFNWIVVITVFQFGSYFGNSVGLLTAWGILRDIGNILLLFGFIFMGIIMILDLHTIDTRKAIPTLIIMAVLINFSLFAAEAVIDVANVLSASMYNQAGGASDQCTTAVASGAANACVNQGISAKVMNAAGLSGAFASKDGPTAQLQKLGSDNTHKLIVYLALTVFVAVTAVVLLAASVMLIIRAVILTFVMVLAPLGFAAMAIPPLAGLGKQWRDLLISQAFFAPVYLLLLLVSLKIMEAVQAAMTGNSNPATLFDALNTANTTYGTIFIVFALVIGFMIAALMSAKKLGAVGADFATSFATKTVRGTMTAPVRAIGAPLYRNTVGKYAGKLADLERSPGFAGSVARTLNSATAGGFQSTLKKAHESKFLGEHSRKEREDFKEHESHTADIAKNKGTILKGLKAGKGTKEWGAMESSFQKLPEADVIKLLNDLSDADAVTAGTVLSTGKFKKIIDNEKLGHHAKDNLIAGRYKTARDAIKDGRIADAQEVVKEYSAKEFEIMATNDTELFTKTLNATAADGGSIVKEGVIDDLIKSEVINSTQQEEARNSRKSSRIKVMLKNKGAPGFDITKLRTLIQKSEGKRFAEQLSNDDLLEPEISVGMNAGKLAAIMAKDSFTKAQKEQFLDQIETHFMTLPSTDPEYQAYEEMKAYLDANKSARTWWSRKLI